MSPGRLAAICVALVGTFAALPRLHAAEPSVDLAGYREDCGVAVRWEGDRLSLAWPMGGDEAGQLVLDLRPGQPLIRSMGIQDPTGESLWSLLTGVDPMTFLLVGSRQAPGFRPPEMIIFNVVFDSP